MKRGEKFVLCGLIAAWEWQQGGSTSEAAAYGRCASSLAQAVGVTDTDADLAFCRAWEVAGLFGDRSDDMVYALQDAFEDDTPKVTSLVDAGVVALTAWLIENGYLSKARP